MHIFFLKKKNFFKRKYINLLINILKVIFLNAPAIRKNLIHINSNDLIKNKIKSNIIFSKEKINLKKLN